MCKLRRREICNVRNEPEPIVIVSKQKTYKVEILLDQEKTRPDTPKKQFWFDQKRASGNNGKIQQGSLGARSLMWSKTLIGRWAKQARE